MKLPGVTLAFLMLALHPCAQMVYPMGPGLNGPVYKILSVNDTIYVGGNFTNAGGIADADYIAKWNGMSWEAVATGLNGAVHTLLMYNGQLHIGGAFTDAGGNPKADFVAKLDGDHWNALGEGLDGPVYALSGALGNLFAGGAFSTHLAQWNGGFWSSEYIALNGPVYALSGNAIGLAVGGGFDNAGEHPQGDRIAYWIGLWWENMGNGFSGGHVFDFLEHTSGFYFTGDFNVCPAPFNPEPHTLRLNPTPPYYIELGDENECRSGSALCAIGDDIYVAVIDFISGDAGLHRYNVTSKTWTYFLIQWVPDILSEEYKIALETDGENIYIGHSFSDLMSDAGDNIVRYSPMTTALSQQEDGRPMSVYPNPATGQIHLMPPVQGESFTYRILDVEGRQLRQDNTLNPWIDVSTLPAGLYMLQVYQHSRFAVETFMVK